MMMNYNLKKYQIFFGVIFVAIAVFAIVQATLPAEESTAVSNLFASITLFGQEVSEVKVFSKTLSIEEFASFLRKLAGHFGIFAAFAASGFFTFFSGKNFKKAVIIDLLAAFWLALTTETIQYFSPGRAFMVSDIVLDMQGAITAIAVISATVSIIFAKKRKNRKGVFPLVAIASLVFAILFLLFNDDSFYTYFCYFVFIVCCLLSSIALLFSK